MGQSNCVPSGGLGDKDLSALVISGWSGILSWTESSCEQVVWLGPSDDWLNHGQDEKALLQGGVGGTEGSEGTCRFLPSTLVPGGGIVTGFLS